jgi:hypothetical protein
LHKAEGLLEKKDDGTRKHMAPEHMITVMTGCKALGELLGLEEQDIRDLVLIGAVHDVNKDIEFKLVRAGINDPAAGYGQKGYDLAGDISEQKLRFAGVPEEIVEAHDKTGHASCPEVEKLLQDTVDKVLSPADVKALVLHYVDDIVTNPNIIDPALTEDDSGNRLNALDRRCIQNEHNATYKNFNIAWQTDPRNVTGETAFVMQRRVGHLVEARLASLAGVEDPLTLPAVIYAKMQKEIQEYWDKRDQKTEL